MKPLLLFAHGAGAGSSHPWMQEWAQRLADVGHVVTFDYPYMAAGKRRPDRAPKLLEAHRQALADARADHPGPFFLVGKSMGSRMGCHLADEVGATGVICFGYPLVGMNGKMRDEVLVALRTPILFLQGTRDRLCPLETLAEVRERMSAPSTVHVVDSGDHSLKITKAWTKQNGLSQDDVNDRMLPVIRSFVQASLQ